MAAGLIVPGTRSTPTDGPGSGFGWTPGVGRSYGAGYGGGGAGGYGLSSQRAGRLRRPGDPPPPGNPDLVGLSNPAVDPTTGAILDPESLFNIRGKAGNRVSMDRLQGMAAAERNYNGAYRPQSMGAAAGGFGDIGSSTGLRKLIQQRMAGVL